MNLLVCWCPGIENRFEGMRSYFLADSSSFDDIFCKPKIDSYKRRVFKVVSDYDNKCFAIPFVAEFYCCMKKSYQDTLIK